MSQKDRFEVIVVGAGIAGASVAAFLAERGEGNVLLVEREAQPAYHATGRSAAMLVELNRHPLWRRLISLGGRVLRRPPAWLADQPLVDRVGVVVPAAGAAWAELQHFEPRLRAEGIATRLIDADAARALVPVLDPGAVDGALLLPENGHLDVHALLQGYLRRLTRAGGEVRCGTEVCEVLRERGRCAGVGTPGGPLRARWVVNAAGAWAGVLGQLAGAVPIAFQARRRTIVTFAAPAASEVGRWPMVDSEVHQAYFKPESGGLLTSPMDETPSPPCDAHPADEDVARAMEKLGRLARALVPQALRRKWAGLRTFAPDEVPVIGEDPLVPGFFWLAGQGGSGIETSPVLGQLAADLLLDGTSTHEAAAALAPGRFAPP
ncbi:MAG: FAD-binding oxidoreductase [Deltaproteobacteria bacterium]|nr:FAD-binding oxidoreductase [Deltaproteobacteria bacterium]